MKTTLKILLTAALAITLPMQAHAQYEDGQVAGLPKVRPCTQDDLIGIWKLVSIAEDPVGPTTEAFYREPQQYIWFQETSIYGEENGIQAYADKNALMQVIRRKESQALLQYIVTEKGIIYTYKNRIATDGLNCAYVVDYLDPYRVGDIILFASEKNPTRLMKLYRQPFPGSGPKAAHDAEGAASPEQAVPATTAPDTQPAAAVAPVPEALAVPQAVPTPAEQVAPAAVPAAQQPVPGAVTAPMPESQPVPAPEVQTAPAPAQAAAPEAQPVPAPEVQTAPAPAQAAAPEAQAQPAQPAPPPPPPQLPPPPQ